MDLFIQYLEIKNEKEELTKLFTQLQKKLDNNKNREYKEKLNNYIKNLNKNSDKKRIRLENSINYIKKYLQN